ncbi:hypothetical protein Cni_G18060 [Canna indica]|uniref:TFIIS N-terminal domain-containing protein n=1 Tax=Canna indica TaxID=4628 RepID=A0AAQ3KJU1_9LILI|nr:hypothetical protein Cni_G18060 [Canna indica]
MGYDNDPYMDEDGEPLMDPDMPSDRELSPEPAYPVDDGDEDDWRRDRSVTPVLGSGHEGKGGKPRKRLIKKSANEGATLNDREDNGNLNKNRKGNPSLKEGKSGSGKEKRAPSSSKGDRPSGKGSGFGLKGHKSGLKDRAANSEVDEFWNTIAGGDSEEDKEGVRTVDDDAFIDDSGIDPAYRYGSDNEAASAGNAPEAEEGEEDDEIKQLFQGGRKRKKNEKSPAEIALLVEHLMAELEVTAEEDAELNRQSKPAINKLRKLPLLLEVLSKKNLQQEFLDHGVLTLLKNWLEPLPDGSLPNMNIRTAILQILSDFPIDLEQHNRKEQLKRSGLGKVIMFLSKSDEETTSNRKLAKELVDKWSRPIFNKSIRFEDMRSFEEERAPYRRPSSLKKMATARGFKDDDIDLADFAQARKPEQETTRQLTYRPEALPMDFVVRPQSKIDPEEVRARAKQVVHDQRRIKMNKRLQKLKAPKKKQLQASKAQGFGGDNGLALCFNQTCPDLFPQQNLMLFFYQSTARDILSTDKACILSRPGRKLEPEKELLPTLYRLNRKHANVLVFLTRTEFI